MSPVQKYQIGAIRHTGQAPDVGFDRRGGGFGIDGDGALRYICPVKPTYDIIMSTTILLSAPVAWFVQGGPLGMSILTVILVLMLLAAWKAPAWVKEIGIAALVFGIFYQVAGILQMLGFLQESPETGPGIIYGGLKVSFIPTLYGMAIYFVSLIFRIVQKPRI